MGTTAEVPCPNDGYDNLGRPQRKTYGDSPEVVTFSYDDPAVLNSKTRLTKVANSASETHVLEYDALGRVKRGKQKTEGIEYPFVYDYNAQDTLKSVTYPSGHVITYAADGLSRITSVARGTTEYASSFVYSPHGAVHSAKIGNWVNQTCFNSRLQPTLIRRGAAFQTNCVDSTLNDALRVAYTYKRGEQQRQCRLADHHAAGQRSVRDLVADALV